jgi:taurine dioxygenase
LNPIGAEAQGIDLSFQDAPPSEVVGALEHEMGIRGFLVLKREKQREVDHFCRTCCWWGGQLLHSTHGVHPAVHVHPVSGRQCIWLLLGITGEPTECGLPL